MGCCYWCIHHKEKNGNAYCELNSKKINKEQTEGNWGRLIPLYPSRVPNWCPKKEKSNESNND